MIPVCNSWSGFLAQEANSDYYKELKRFLASEYKNNTVYPPMGEIFKAFQETDYLDVKVVILGQDPYHGKGQAMGMSFSVNDDVKPPPSLKNIIKEIQSDIGSTQIVGGNLTSWAKQGVMLLNTTLTVRESTPLSHCGKGWETFTDHIIQILNNNPQPIVFMLWGKNAQSKENLITNPNHLILKAAHPSPLSANNGFFGCKHFSKANEFLKEKEIEPIEW